MNIYLEELDKEETRRWTSRTLRWTRRTLRWTRRWTRKTLRWTRREKLDKEVDSEMDRGRPGDTEVTR